MRDAMPLVELRQVSKRFGSVQALREVSLQIGHAEFFSLLGPSGCGKTTSLRILAGFEEPTAGAVLLNGVDQVQVPPNRRNVNTVFQNYALFPHMSVAENIAFGLKMKRTEAGEIRRRVAAVLDLIAMTGYDARRPSQLSGGQQQRVALARALVNEPAVLLLDEPLGALDAALRKQMQSELTKLQRTVGITFIYVTHDQEEALAMSDRIAVMSGGVVQQVGTPLEIYEHPRNRFTAAFIGLSNLFEGRVAPAGAGAADGEIDVVVDDLGPLAVRTEARPAPGARVSVMVRPEKMHLAPNGHRPGSGNAFAGVVDGLTYTGTGIQYRIRLGQRHLVTVYDLNQDRAKAPCRPGETVWVSWRPDNASVIAE